MTLETRAARGDLPATARRAFGWWLSELRAIWTDAGRRFGRGAGPVLEAGEFHWTLRERGRIVDRIDPGGGAAMPAHHPAAAGPQPVRVEIPKERGLYRIVALPARASRDLDRILAFEFARQFPFPADRVFLCHRIVEGPAGFLAGDAGGTPDPTTITVELVAMPRDLVAALLDEIASAGFRPTALDVTSGGRRMPLPDAAWRPVRPSRRVPRPLLLATVLLAVLAILSWPLGLGMRLASIDRELAGLSPRALAALQERERTDRAGEQLAAVLKIKAARPPMVQILDSLSRIVPESSWLTSLGISDRRIVLEGLAPSAAATALSIEKSGAFAEVSFTAPITRDPATGLEHFQLAATLPATPR